MKTAEDQFLQANQCRYLDNQKKSKFYEVWYFKWNRIEEQDTFWFRYTLLKAENHPLKHEIWGIYHSLKTGQRFAKRDVTTFDVLPPFQQEGKYLANGKIQNSLFWSFQFEQRKPQNPMFPFYHVPQIFQKIRIAKSTVCKPFLDICFDGQLSIGDQKLTVKNALGCQGHIWGSKYAHSWVWAHCNIWYRASTNSANTNGASTTPMTTRPTERVILEMLSARIQIAGLVTSPTLSALFLYENNQSHTFNSFKECISIQSSFSLASFSLASWQLTAENEIIKITVEVSTKPEHLNGVTYETTDSGTLFCHNTAFANAKIVVFDKVENATRVYDSHQTTSFESVSNKKDPSVEFIL